MNKWIWLESKTRRKVLVNADMIEYVRESYGDGSTIVFSGMGADLTVRESPQEVYFEIIRHGEEEEDGK